jgi:hypothetical protein
MATVRDFYTGDGTTVLFSLSFEYLDQDDILVTVNGVPTTAFGFVNASTIQFSVAPANGADIAIIRQTPVDDPKAVFFAGSPIRAADLNQNNTQLLYVAQETSQLSDDANINSNLAITTANGAVATANTAEANSLTAISTANTAESNSLAAVSTANTAESNSLAAVSTANAASVTAGNAVSTANSAVSTANAATVTANAATATANQAALDAAAAVVTANAADVKADAAVLTANAADANASAAVITANAADVNASAAVVTANTAESNSLAAISTANSAAAAVASAVLYTPVIDLAALALLTPLDGEFFELQDSTGADTDPSITGVPVGLIGAAGLTFRLRYDDPPGEYVFLGYFANDSETRYLKTGTGTVTSTNILDGTIVDADINASAAIAGTKISPDFGSQAVTTTGLISANGKVSFPLGTAALPSLYPGTDTNTGIYSPGADQLAISTNGTGRLTVGTTAVSSTLAVDHPLGAVGTPSITFTGDLNTGFWSPAADTLAASTGGSERLRILSDGKVGLGSSSPNTRLSVVGSATGLANGAIRTNTTAGTQSANSGLWLCGNQATTHYNWLIASQFNIGGALEITPSTAVDGATFTTPTAVFTQTGRLGIGTTTVSDTLHVNTTSGSTTVRLSSATNASGLQITARGDGTGTQIAAFGTSSDLRFFTTNSGGSTNEAFRVDSSQRLLVGTSTADTSGNALLQVNGSIKGTITSGTSVASTSGTSIDFTGIPSWVKRITVMFQGVSTNGSSLYLLQLGTSSGVTTSGYLGRVFDGSGFESAFSAGFTLNTDGGAAHINHGLLQVATLGSNIFAMNGALSRSDAGNQYLSAGAVTLSGTLDRIRITTVNGTDTFDAGTINILYEG